MSTLLTTVTAELTREVSKSIAPTAEDSTDIASTAARAVQLVETHVGTATVPTAILELATIEVARELWTHRDAPAGIFTAFGDSSPVRLARDPLRGAYAILSPYLGGGFA